MELHVLRNKRFRLGLRLPDSVWTMRGAVLHKRMVLEQRDFDLRSFWGPENWVDGTGQIYRLFVTTTSHYAYGQIRDTSYMGGGDSPTIEAFAN